MGNRKHYVITGFSMGGSLVGHGHSLEGAVADLLLGANISVYEGPENAVYMATPTLATLEHVTDGSVIMPCDMALYDGMVSLDTSGQIDTVLRLRPAAAITAQAEGTEDGYIVLTAQNGKKVVTTAEKWRMASRMGSPWLAKREKVAPGIAAEAVLFLDDKQQVVGAMAVDELSTTCESCGADIVGNLAVYCRACDALK